ncbi:MAG: hypothetical protein DRN71_05445 [Candidatus Nanohalarchaeota archaeon]|nr:MAG: hypothetical protein DRN71_05445 [Candidatus Nanohaloarchaeota archaeon]
MNKEELIEKPEDLEWEDFEVKEAKSEIPKSSWETVSAFSNTASGWLVFGIKKTGKKYDILGVENPEKIEQDFTTILRNESKFNQKIRVKCRKHIFENRNVMAFYIHTSEKKPVYFNSRKNTFIRTGSGDQRATDNEIDAMYREQAFSSKDKELTEFTYADLDAKTIDDYRIYLNNVNREYRYNKLSAKEMLEKLQVLINGKVTVGGLLVFGKQDDIDHILTDLRIDYLEIPGTSYSNAPTRYTYRLSEEVNLFRFYFSIIERLVKKIDIPFIMRSDGLATNRQPQMTAIREALVNPLIHSDYFSTMKPRVRVFLNRIEFMNPCALPKDIKSIMKEEFTQPRNTIITRIFRAIKLAENAGSGFDKMFTCWKSYYKNTPKVSGEVDYYRIEFYFDSIRTSQKQGVEKGVENISDKQKTILDLIRKNPPISKEQIEIQGALTKKSVDYNIQKLKDMGLLKRIGPDKGGHWKIIKE